MKRRKPLSTGVLLARYRNPLNPGSLGGLTRFAKDNNISVKGTREVLERDLEYTLHKPRRHRFPTNPVVVFGIEEQWVTDLIEVGNIAKGYRYLVMVVDMLSKHAWVQPVKNKTGQAVTDAFEKILKWKRKPINLQTDDGKEFYNKTFQDLMKRKGIHHFLTSGDTKASVVKRFHRTLKKRMYRYFTVRDALSYPPMLKELVLGYNRSYHRSIKMAPEKVNAHNEEQVWKNLYAKRLGMKRPKPKLKVGDRIRLNKKYRVFKKGYLPGWTEEVFVVARVTWGVVLTYKIDKWDGTPLSDTFHTQDLQKVTVMDDDLFRVQRIIKRKGDEVLVRWKG